MYNFKFFWLISYIAIVLGLSFLIEFNVMIKFHHDFLPRYFYYLILGKRVKFTPLKYCPNLTFVILSR